MIPARVEGLESARPEAPIAEPEAPPGAGPGAGLTGAFPIGELPCPPPADEPAAAAAAKETAAVARPMGESESKR
jgi:hypothetical protein